MEPELLLLQLDLDKTGDWMELELFYFYFYLDVLRLDCCRGTNVRNMSSSVDIVP